MCDFFAIRWTVAHQASLSMGFPRQEYGGGLPFPPPGYLPNPGIKLTSPAVADGFFTTEPPGKPYEAFVEDQTRLHTWDFLGQVLAQRCLIKLEHNCNCPEHNPTEKQCIASGSNWPILCLERKPFEYYSCCCWWWWQDLCLFLWWWNY